MNINDVERRIHENTGDLNLYLIKTWNHQGAVLRNCGIPSDIMEAVL